MRPRSLTGELLQELGKLQTNLNQIHLPKVRYESHLLGRMPASTMLYASIPNLAEYLTEAQSVFNRQLAESPELKAAWTARGIDIDPVIDKLRAASDYLGDEIAIIALSQQSHGPVFLAETHREGFREFLKKQIPQAVWNVPRTRSPISSPTASPLATTVPTYSCPIVKPGSIWTRP